MADSKKVVSYGLRPAILAAAACGVMALSGCAGVYSGDVEPSVEPTALIAMDPALIEEIQVGIERHEQLFRDVVACVEAEGWDVTVLGNQTFTIEGVSPEQQPLADNAYRTCSEETGWSRSSAIDRDALAKLYGYELKTLDCLESLGWTVSEPPSLEVYVERFSTSNSWSAYSEIRDQMTESEVQGNEEVPSWDVVNATCPQPIHWADLN
ncbi:hypothetical protein [Agromyces sp. ZXT2-3]|uniref:hypothetical protein n=1 Tax=Agromyces sp. ZXT2-3 TaxID=3461152 RepID=UPI004054D4E8